MEHAITFDTLAFAKKLESSGIQSKQAEAIAEAMRDVLDENISPQVFKKQDGVKLETKMENKFDVLEKKIDVKISNLKTELVMWMMSLLMVQSSLLFSIIKFAH